MLRIALATMRDRWTAFIGTFAAVTLGVAIIATTSLVLAAADQGESHQRPQRFAAVSEVIRADPDLHVKDRYGSLDAVPYPDQPGLSAAQIARYPGAVADRSFAVLVDGRSMTGHPWSSAAFTPYRLTAGHAPAGPGEIVIGGAASLVGRVVTVETASAIGSYRVSGVTAPVAFEHAVFFSGAQAVRLCPQVDALVPRGPVPGVAVPGVQVLTGAARRQADPGYLAEAASFSDLTSFVGIAALLAGFISLYVTASAFGLSVSQRRRDLALLRMTGAVPGQMIRLVCGEALLLGVAGSAAGCALGLLGGPAAAGWMARQGLAPAWFTAPPSAVALMVAFLAGVLISVLAVAVACVRSARVHPLEALREATADDRTRVSRLRLPGGIAAVLCGIGMLASFLVFPASVADLKSDAEATLLLVAGTAMLVPYLVPRLVRAATRRSGSFAGMLIRENISSGLRHASGVVTPVLVTAGLAATLSGCVTVLATATSSAPLAARGYVIDPGLSAPLMRSLRADGIRATAITDTTVLAYEPAITPLHLEAPIPLPYPAIAVDRPDELRVTVTAGSLARLDDGTVAVDASWHKSVGARLRLWLADGAPVSLRVVAVFHAGLRPTLILNAADAAGSFPSLVEVSADTAAVQAIAARAGASVVPAARWSAAASGRQDQQNRLGLVVLIGIVTAYGAIGIMTTIAMAWRARRGERELLHLSGATRGQLLRVSAGEIAVLTGAGLILALAVCAVTIIAVAAAVGP